MKRIAIVSPYKEYNYGTVLQAYALQRTIEELGCQVEYLQFTTRVPPSLWEKILSKVLSIVPPKNPVHNVGLDDYSFFKSPEFEEFANGFERFVSSRIKVSSVRYNPNTLSLCRDYDAYMVGSDQTWGEARTKTNLIFFLDYVNERYPKLSYAPSIGTTHISSGYLEILKTQLQKFKSLSCREKTNCTLLSKELGREVSYVLDPTLLLSPDDWNQIAETHHDKRLKKKQYILCYILGEKENISDYAEKLGEEKGLPVYYIVTRPLYLQKEKHVFATPESFLSMIRDAETVITDSFHGTIFCINYRTQFYSFTKRENSNALDNDRILEILSSFRLSNRFREGRQGSESDIDYEKVTPILENFRGQSLDYLRNTLSGI